MRPANLSSMDSTSQLVTYKSLNKICPCRVSFSLLKWNQDLRHGPRWPLHMSGLGEDNWGQWTPIMAAMALNGDACITQNARAFYGPLGHRLARWNHKQLIYRQQPLCWNTEYVSNAGYESTRHPGSSPAARVTRLLRIICVYLRVYFHDQHLFSLTNKSVY